MPTPTVCLPMVDWADHLEPPRGVEVVVWSPDDGEPPDGVTFYVPSYMGPPAALTVMANLPRLEVVQTLSAGYDDVLPHLPGGVTLCNARGVHDASTAELAVGLVIASLRGFGGFVRSQDQHRWEHAHRPALADRRVVVVGAGSVGRAIAARLAPFESDVVLVGRSARAGVAGVDSLPALLGEADVVVLAVPLTAQTQGLVGADFLALLRDGALLVNVARGPVVDTEALVQELQSGRLLAALDVTDPEPLPPGHPLWSAPGVLISPHVGGDTSAFLPRAWRLLRDQLTRYGAHEPLANIVVAGTWSTSHEAAPVG